jgi:MraZ protein
MFLGEFTHSLDDKGRLTLPAKFRQALAGGVVVTMGIDACLAVYPRSVWDPLAENIAGLPVKQRHARRHFFQSATDCIPDRQGRVLISPVLRKYAGLDGEATIIGLYDRLEVWNPDRLAETKTQEDPELVAEQLNDFGI